MRDEYERVFNGLLRKLSEQKYAFVQQRNLLFENLRYDQPSERVFNGLLRKNAEYNYAFEQHQKRTIVKCIWEEHPDTLYNEAAEMAARFGLELKFEVN